MNCEGFEFGDLCEEFEKIAEADMLQNRAPMADTEDGFELTSTLAAIAAHLQRRQRRLRFLPARSHAGS